MKDSVSTKHQGTVNLYFQLKLPIAKLIIDLLLNFASKNYKNYKDDFEQIKQVAILNGVSAKMEPSQSLKGLQAEKFYDPSPSVINTMKVISILLSLQEQCWLSTQNENS